MLALILLLAPPNPADLRPDPPSRLPITYERDRQIPSFAYPWYQGYVPPSLPHFPFGSPGSWR